MDWIDELLGKWKHRVRKSSLKRALTLYIIVAIITVGLLYSITMMFCSSWRNLISQQYSSETITVITDGVPTNQVIAPTNESNMKALDRMLVKVINFVELFSILLYTIIAIYLTSHFFYKNKIQEPVSILKEETKYIARDDLSFSCLYESGDELGEICESFDAMRIQLINNEEKIWSLMESQRQLNAAFAHDLRTPLTVMQGYTELLVKYYPEGKVSEEKLLDTLQLLHGQVTRLQQFAETMKGIHTFEAMEIKKKKQDFSILKEKIIEIIHGLQLQYEFDFHIESKLPEGMGYYDLPCILEVLDNLLSNAISYAKTSINLVLGVEENQLVLYLRDDGKGFSKEELYMATRPYYTGRGDGLGHFGIGLTISKLLCEKHGGTLHLSNSTKGGAILAASFLVM
jgi:two-component system, OmpR family, lantibiotic biosynthesis sensor histidine kinase NisK/SpaK